MEQNADMRILSLVNYMLENTSYVLMYYDYTVFESIVW
jgi:hypothetical protein